MPLVHRIGLFALLSLLGTLVPLVAPPARPTHAALELLDRPPVSAPAQLGGPGWDDQFGFPGTSFYVSALAAGGGNLFVAISPLSGSVGYLDVSHIARWDGRRWHRMGWSRRPQHRRRLHALRRRRHGALRGAARQQHRLVARG